MELWHRSSGVFKGCVKTEYVAAADRKKRSTERFVRRKGKGRGQFPHPPLEGQGEGRGAYSVLSSDVLEWYVFPGYPIFPLDVVEIDDHTTLLHQTIYHVNQLKIDHLTAKHLCHHIHSGLIPENLTRVHPEDEDTPILAIPFGVKWKTTWLSEDIVRSIPNGISSIHNYRMSKPPLRKKTRKPPPPNSSASPMRIAPSTHHLYHPFNQPRSRRRLHGVICDHLQPHILGLGTNSRPRWTYHLPNPESQTPQTHNDIPPTRIHNYSPRSNSGRYTMT